MVSFYNSTFFFITGAMLGTDGGLIYYAYNALANRYFAIHNDPSMYTFNGAMLCGSVSLLLHKTYKLIK